jgi:hypothetical protein
MSKIVILTVKMGFYGLDLYLSGQRQMKDSYEHEKKTFSSIKCSEILEQLSDWQFLR